MRKLHISLQLKFLLSIAFLIAPVLSIIIIWIGIQNEKHTKDQMLNQARILSDQIILTRQWVSDSGGILINKNNTESVNIPAYYNEQVKTVKGIYQVYTPSMVTKVLSRYSRTQSLYQFRLAGLNPVNPENKPDLFEKKALKAFADDNSGEIWGFADKDRQHFFRYSVPLYVDKTCIKCHKSQGYSTGTVAGCLSIIFPVTNIVKSMRNDRFKLAFAGIGFIFLTVLLLFSLLKMLIIRPLKKLEKITDVISSGDLKARIHMDTGDEFERLGTAFNIMGERLSRNRHELEEKIAQATYEIGKANKELKSLDKLKSDFIATMSHELRSPLTAIRGGVDYLKRTLIITDNLNYLDIIDKNLSRLIHLVSDLFDFTKIEAKKIDWSFEQENLAGLIREVIEILTPLFMDKKIRISYKYPGDINCKFDLERIEQVLVNLIDNAIKFSETGSKISIKLSRDKEFVIVSIKDQGTGIPGDKLKTIFDKFSTLPSGSRTQNKGTGLGLAISKAIIEAHGGRIWAESRPGAGSTFFFSLPL